MSDERKSEDGQQGRVGFKNLFDGILPSPHTQTMARLDRIIELLERLVERSDKADADAQRLHDLAKRR